MAQVLTHPGSAQFKWLFQQLACHANDRNFIEEAFSEKEPVRCAVREIVQNTGDCARDGVPAELRLTWTSVPRKNLDAVHFDEIVERISGIEESSRNFGRALNRGQTLNVLLIEDNGTGMGGEWRRAPKANEKPGGLQAFGRGFGNSSKGRGASGSKGLGRSAIVNASDAHLIYCHTVRVQDGVNFFFGMSLLDLHSYRGNDYKPDGYLYVYGNDEKGAPIAPPLPGEAAMACASALGSSRAEKEFGSSIFVPAVRDEFGPTEFAKYLIQDHFVQIANGMLTVVLKAPGIDLTLDHSTIEAAAADPDLGGSPGHAALVRAAVRILACAKSGASDLGLLTDVSELREIPDDMLAALREKYAQGVPACIRIELTARKVGERSGRTGHLVLAALRADDLANGASILMRDGNTRIDSLPNDKAVVMAIAIDGTVNPVAEMLRDGEDPSHMKWESANMKRKGWADQPAKIVRTVFCEGGRIVLDVLASRDMEEDYDVYADLFGIDTPAEPDCDAAEENPAKEEKKSNNGEMSYVSVLASEMIPPDEKSGNWGFKAFLSPIGLDLIDGGTRLTNARIGTVYAYGEGSTELSKHSIGDFDLRKFEVSVKGGKIKQIGINDITLNDLSRDFELKVVGPFSRHRGLHAVLINCERESEKPTRGRKKKES